MCNRARNLGEPETLIERFGGGWLTDKPMDNRFNLVELVPRGRAYVIRRDGKANGLDVMSGDLLGNGAAYPITNVKCSPLNVPGRSRAKPRATCNGCLPTLARILCRKRLGKVIALDCAAADLHQNVGLLLRFHPFRDDVEIERGAEPDDQFDDGTPLAICRS
jgi:hypothetical protein